MNHPYHYVGCFLSLPELQALTAELRTDPLPRTIEVPHVTFVYRPMQVDRSLFGTPVEVTIVGYGNDGRNEGVRVRLHCSHPEVAALAEQIAVPHITLATGPDGRSVDTAGLTFRPVPPRTIRGVFGGCITGRSVDLTGEGAEESEK